MKANAGCQPLSLALIVIVCSLTGCPPSLDGVAFYCDDTAQCPSGMVCGPDNKCIDQILDAFDSGEEGLADPGWFDDGITDIETQLDKGPADDSAEEDGKDILDDDVCVPDCVGKECGDNGCGGSCGTCTGVKQCIAGQCSCEVEALNGEDDDCDGHVDEDFDLDHDGVCDSPDCPVEDIDTCPTVWNPDNDPVLCPPVESGDWKLRQLKLQQPDTPDGTSTWRRTNEPLEIPLWNGILDDSVVGYWKLDGGQASDFSGNGNHGTVSQAQSAQGAFFHAEGSLVFDGSTSKIEIEGISDEELCPDNFTVSAWIKTTAGWQQDIVVAATTISPYKWWSLTVNDAGLGSSHWDDGPGDQIHISCPIDVADGEWHLLTATMSEQQHRFYVDGSLCLTATMPDSEGCISTGPVGYLNIGYNYPDKPHPFLGSIDDVLILRRALSPGEIAVYYQSRKPYGTDMVPFSQPDFDGVRISEVSPQQAEHVIPSEVIGIRPHSDTPCLMADDDGTWADRDDLCGVVGYWKLDGSFEDSSGNSHHLPVDPSTDPFKSGQGRFGDDDGAFYSAFGKTTIASTTASQFTLSEFTIEGWVLFQSTDYDVHIVRRGSKTPQNENYSLTVMGGTDQAECTYRDQTGAGFDCTTIGSVPSGRWIHLGCTRTDSVLIVYVNGIEEARCASPPIPMLDTNANLRVAASDSIHQVDEVLVHSTAKSPDYFYRRANPGVPTVRFLAHTEPYTNPDGNYDFLEYNLRWTDADATQDSPILTGLDQVTKCHGLLSPCLGYFGWWRFNEPSGTRIIDESSSRHTGYVHYPTTERVPSLEGLGLRFDAVGDHAYYAPPSPFLLTDFTVEAGFLAEQLSTTDYQVLVLKGISSDPENVNFAMGVMTTEQSSGFFEHGSGEQVPVYGNTMVSLSTWHHQAIRRDSAHFALYFDYGLESEMPDPPEPVADSWNNTYFGTSRRPAKNSWQDNFFGILDSVRIMDRSMESDEFLHFPLTDWSLEPCQSGEADSDCDGDPDTTDCAPMEPSVFNGAIEVCNVIDDDCDGTTDGDGLCPLGQGCIVGICIADDFVEIPAGTFWMGSPGGEPCPVGYTGGGCDGTGTGNTEPEDGHDDVDEILHEVTLTYGIEVQTHEVTQGEWKTAFGGWNPAESNIGDEHPVETVSWYDALVFANWRSLLEGFVPCYAFTDVICEQGGNPTDGTDAEFCLNGVHGGIDAATIALTEGVSKPQDCEGFRLLTDAEWEYATRAGTTSAFYDGHESNTEEHCELPVPLAEIAWFCANNDPKGTKEVGLKQANAFGLKDMTGNVQEWTWDRYCHDNTGYGPDPDGSSCWTSDRSVRGGYYYNWNLGCRSANRGFEPPGDRDDWRGVRLGRTLNGSPCVPDCTGKECGDDGCGGSCGVCDEFANSFCNGSGQCECALNSCSGPPIKCEGPHDDGCGATMTCPACTGCGEQCQSGFCEFVSCNGKQCGDDGCGGSCGTCTPPKACTFNTCI